MNIQSNSLYLPMKQENPARIWFSLSLFLSIFFFLPVIRYLPTYTAWLSKIFQASYNSWRFPDAFCKATFCIFIVVEIIFYVGNLAANNKKDFQFFLFWNSAKLATALIFFYTVYEKVIW